MQEPRLPVQGTQTGDLQHGDRLTNKNILTYCETGERAGKAKDILEAADFKAFNGGGYERILEIVGAK